MESSGEEAVTMSEYGLPVRQYDWVAKQLRTLMPGQFSSDDFRLLGLDKQLTGHKANRIGGFFRYLKVNKLAEPTGERVPTSIPKGHKRYITVWKWKR